MATAIQRNFSSGEVSEEVGARADQVKYATGLRTCLNFICERFGGLVNRPGTKHIATAGDPTIAADPASNAIRFIKFVFNDDQAYLIEMGHKTIAGTIVRPSDGYLRFYRNGVPLVVTAAPADWNSGTTYTKAQLVKIAGVYYYAREGVIATVPNLNKDPTTEYTYWSQMSGALYGGKIIYEIPSNYGYGDLRTINYVESADVLPFAHTLYPPAELSRHPNDGSGNPHWEWNTISTTPALVGPAVSSVGGSSAHYLYRVTSVQIGTYGESADPQAFTAAANDQAPITVSWTNETGALEYNVYKAPAGSGASQTQFGYIGTAKASPFIDVVDDGSTLTPGSQSSITPDMSDNPPSSRVLFVGAGNYPGVVTYCQQRLVFAGSINEPDTIWGSKTGDFHNYCVSRPAHADDAITFPLVSRRVNRITGLMQVDRLVALTSDSVWTINGDGDGTITQTAPNARQQAVRGASALPPLIVGSTPIFEQVRGGGIRAFRFDTLANAALADELSVFSAHLFAGHTIIAWDFAETPHGVVWMVRDDGVLIGMTWLPEQQVVGFHRHTTGAGDVIEDVAVLPENGRDVVYLLVRRMVGGVAQRHIEAMQPRNYAVADIASASWFVDDAVEYDGWDHAAITITITDAGSWVAVTLTASAPLFSAADATSHGGVSDFAFIMTLGGQAILLTGITYVDSTHIRATQIALGDYPGTAIPAPFRGATIAIWAKAVSIIPGLSHLEGRTVTVAGWNPLPATSVDGPKIFTGQVVAGGATTIPLHYWLARYRVGLSYASDMETLTLEPSQSTLLDKRKLIGPTAVSVKDTCGFKIGPDSGSLSPAAITGANMQQDLNTAASGTVVQAPPSRWDDYGRVFIRQDRPLPLAVLAVAPTVVVGG